MKIEIFQALSFGPATRPLRARLATAFAGALLLATAMPRAQAQTAVPAPNGNSNTKWVMVDDQIVPASAIISAGKGLSLPTGTGGALSLFPNARKWPGGRVPYEFDASMSAAKQAIFLRGARQWERYANLRFTPRSGQANYILVVSTANVSNSFIGMQGNGQVLNLADWANDITAMHELAHALGVIHEQSRPDRDTYVTINEENIQDALAFNFAKIGGALNQGDYDFGSMMHYPRNAFTKNGLDTITANTGYTQFQNVMGQRSRASDLDKKGMALIYGDPVAFGGSLTPAEPKTNDTLTATPTVAPGATETDYSYVWKKNGEVIRGEITDKLDLSKAGNGDKGDLISVEVTGPDENGANFTEVSQVTIANSAPVTPDRSFETDSRALSGDEDTARKTLSGQLAATDDDNDDPLTFIRVANVSNGQLTLNSDGSFTYLPNRGFSGTDGFKVAANDGQTSGMTATITINVNLVNEAPVLADASLEAIRDFPFSFQLQGTDGNGDDLSYSIIDSVLPDGLTLSSDGVLSGTPTTQGTTVVTIQVDDGRGVDNSASTGKITIKVKIDDRPPTVSVLIKPAAPKTNETVTVTATVSDPTGNAVTTIYDFKVNGESVQRGESNTLDLSKAGNGDKGDVITCEVTATNEGGGTATTTARATVANSAPVAVSGRGSALSGVEKSFVLGGFDVDADTLEFNILSGPSNGKASVRENSEGQLKLFYTSRAGYSGTDVIRFNISDGSETLSNISTFAITVENPTPIVNRAPIAGDTNLDTFVGKSEVKGLLGSDPDGDAITFRIVNNARYGKSEIKRDTDGFFKLFYTSLNRFYDSDRVTYIVTDSRGAQSNVATVFIKFSNRAPVAQSNSLKVAAGIESSQYLFATDPDNDAVTFRLVNNPRYGKGEVKRDAQGKWRVYYTSLPKYSGPDRLTFLATDAKGKQSQVAAIEFTVIPVYIAPSSSPSARTGGVAPSSGDS